jgi:uncharacterized protein (DUF58 family)
MIVPSARMLFWMIVMVISVAIFSTLAPIVSGMWAIIIGAFCVLALFDILVSLGLLRDIDIELPDTIRMTKDREGSFEIKINNKSERKRLLRLGLPFPLEIESSDETLITQLPNGESSSHIEWNCTPRKRGNFTLDACFIEGSSVLGLWDVRSQRPARCRIRVYPNLMSERRGIASLFLNKGGIGVHSVRQVGKGRDFEQLRQYIPGDSYDEIHWKATAKRGTPVTKMFQIERTQEVYVVIDASRLSARAVSISSPDVVTSGGNAEVTILERFISTALILGMVAERQGDLFGLCAFSDKVHQFVRAKNGKAHFNVCRDALYNLHPQSVTPDYDELYTFLRLHLRRRALLIFLTNLDDPVHAESFERNVDIVSRRNLVLVNMLAPPGVGSLFTKPDVDTIDDIYDRLAGHIQWNELREVERSLKRKGVGFSLIQNEQLIPSLVTQYLNVKQRQAL